MKNSGNLLECQAIECSQKLIKGKKIREIGNISDTEQKNNLNFNYEKILICLS